MYLRHTASECCFAAHRQQTRLRLPSKRLPLDERLHRSRRCYHIVDGRFHAAVGWVSRRFRRLGSFFGIWSRWIPSFLKRLDFFSLASRTCTFGTRRVRVASSRTASRLASGSLASGYYKTSGFTALADAITLSVNTTCR